MYFQLSMSGIIFLRKNWICLDFVRYFISLSLYEKLYLAGGWGYFLRNFCAMCIKKVIFFKTNATITIFFLGKNYTLFCTFILL